MTDQIEMSAHSLSSVALESFFSSQQLSMAVDSSSRRQTPRTWLKSIQLGAINVSHFQGEGCLLGHRRLSHIRQDGPSHFIFLQLPLLALASNSQSGRNTLADPGSFNLISTAQPYEGSIRTLPGEKRFSSVNVRIPITQLRERIPNIDDYCARQIEIRPGSGRIMKKHIETLLAESAFLSEADVSSFGLTLLDAITNAVISAPELDCWKHITARVSAHTQVRNYAKSYIETVLSNSNLQVKDIAEHCGVSIRYLHASFAVSSESVASFVKESRLQKCRLMLNSSALSNKSIATIACNWGFDNPEHFSRVYKRRFGISPRLERLSYNKNNPYLK